MHVGAQDVLQACKSLRSLHVCMEAPAAPGGDSSGLLLQIAAALPQLRALQLRCPRKPGRQLRESHFSEEFVAQVAGGDLPGLQLLQVRRFTPLTRHDMQHLARMHSLLTLNAFFVMVTQLENCSFGGEELSLPGSLRFLSLKTEQAPSDAQLHVLLCACTAIEVRPVPYLCIGHLDPFWFPVSLPANECLNRL